MFYYRGCSNEDVIRSVNEAAAFILSLNVGKNTNEWAAAYQKGADGNNALEAAATPQELHEALRQICRRLSRSFRLLTSHAIFNTGGKGEDIYTSLCQWRAFGATSLEWDPSTREIHAYLDSITSTTGLLANPSRGLAYARYITRCLSQKSDILDAKKYEVVPVKSYGIVMSAEDGVMTGNVIFNSEYNHMIDQLIGRLRPYWQMGDVTAVGSRSFEIGGKHKHCIFFDATHAVAQEVAGWYPDKDIISEQGDKVLPPTVSNTIQNPAAPDGRVAAPSQGKSTAIRGQ